MLLQTYSYNAALPSMTSLSASIPRGKTARAAVICACNTRVYARLTSSDGVLPRYNVRVVSIVPSRYCPPESLLVRITFPRPLTHIT